MQLDFQILDFIQENIRSGFLDPIMAVLSAFGKSGIGWIVLGLILLIPKKTRPAAATALCAMALGFLIGDITLKHIVCRSRPYDVYEAFHGYPMSFSLNAGPENSFSFPSGHSVCAFAAAVSYYKINKTVGIAATALALLIAFSRLYNYVHFPTDVIAGVLIGTACALISIFVFKKLSLDDKLRRIGSKPK